MAMNNSLEHFVHDSRNEATIPNNIVWSCYVDKWQNVWIGTDHGLSRLSTHTYYRFTSLDKITFSGEGNCLHAILQTRSGDWWMGGTNGLIHYAEGVRVQGTASEYQNVVWYKQNNPSAFPLVTTVCARFMKTRRGMYGSVQTTESTSTRRVRESCSTSSSMTRPASILLPGLMIFFRIRWAECGWHLIRVASSCWTSSAFWQPSRCHLLLPLPVWQTIISQTRERTPSPVCTSVSWYSMAREWSGLPTYNRLDRIEYPYPSHLPYPWH